jgi:hypothetical protein
MQRNEFEDTQQAEKLVAGFDPKRSRSGGKPLRIFDNQVEHASRENAERSGLIILTM